MDTPRDTLRYQLSRTREEHVPGLSIDWAAELNEQQLAAVTASDGPVLVLAGAGSGKTRVITYRVAFLIAERRVRPQNILLATFTNKAARSMLARAEAVAGPLARDVAGGTFHHFANLQLRRYAKLIGFQSNFTILDESDAQAVMKLCRSEAGLDKAEKAFPSARLLISIASAMVNTHTDLESLLTRRYYHLCEQMAEIERVLIAYHLRKQQSNQMDFDDLLVYFYRLLTEHPEARAALSRRFVHILVDEYQDVNHLQAAIVRELYTGEQDPGGIVAAAPLSAGAPGAEAALAPAYPDAEDEEGLLPPMLAEPPEVIPDVAEAVATTPEQPRAPSPLGFAARGLFVVGDDAQSIYSFRGADYENIRSFPYAFPGTQVYKLETNYRSVPQILTLANAILSDADPLFRKELQPVKAPVEERPLLLACRDADDQADFVAEQILKLREGLGMEFRRMAVLYRAHNNRLEVELEFTKRGIPFIVRGGLRFFEQAHIKDLLSYLLVLANSRDELAWQRMLAMCARVGPKTIANVLTQIRKSRDDEGGLLGRFIHNGVADSARGQAKQSMTELRDFLRALHAEAGSLPLPDLIRRVIDGRYKQYMELQYENWRQRLDDLEQLALFAARFETLHGFLSEVMLNGSFSGKEIAPGREEADPEEGAVTLSTIHQAKGLEWQAVFIIHCQDDVIPHRMAQFDSEGGGEDEERRLLYVAVTRAEELLFMSFPQLTETRDFQRIINRPSRFLAGLPAECYDEGVLEWDES